MVQSGEYESELVLVSNAEPYRHVWKGEEKEETEYEKLTGGLTAALDPLMQELGGKWVAWGREDESDFYPVDENNIIEVPPDAPEDKRYKLKRLELSDEEVENFYLGFSNEVLWPTCHTFPSKVNKKEEYWPSYKGVNEKYADRALEVAGENDSFWIHDYHLTLVPKLISEEKEDSSVSFFLHIPFPPWESFGRVPQREEIMKGLSGSDFIGVHTPTYREHLLNAAEKLGAEVDKEGNFYEWDGRKTKVGALPLGIDYDRYSPANTDLESDFQRGFREAIGTEHVVFGLDRTDYTKGIPERLRAFERFLEDNPEYQGEVTLVQKNTPSRQEIPEYEKILNDIRREAGGINSELGEIGKGWEPVHLRQDKVPHEDLRGLYRSADVGLITPGIDGMNLVAKEYVAAQTINDPGVLVLSEFAGAAEQFKEEIEGKGPVYVNPYDERETANGIKRAIEMPYEEKEERLTNLDEIVREKDSQHWRDEFLKRWEEAAM